MAADRADSDVLWHAGAGVIDARSTVHAMLDLAKQHGAELRTRWPVHGVEKTATGYRVTHRTAAASTPNAS